MAKIRSHFSGRIWGVRKRVVSKRVVLADVAGPPKTGVRVQKQVFLDPKHRNMGTKNGTTVQKKRNEGTFAKPPFYTTAHWFPLDKGL